MGGRLAGTARLAWTALGQDRFAFRSLAAIRLEQQRRLRRAVQHAHDTVPYYRDAMRRLGIRPSEIRTSEDLARLPIVERQEVQRAPDRFLSSVHPRERCLRVRSGGSTGSPQEVCLDPLAVVQNAAFGQRERQVYHELLGRRGPIRSIQIDSNQGTARDVREYLRTLAFVPRPVEEASRTFEVSAPLEQIAAALNEVRPHVVSGFGSCIERLAGLLEEHPSELHRPMLLTYGGDPVSPGVRRRILEELGIQLWTAYQSIESFKIGFECPEHAGLHLHLDLCPVRIVDPEGADLPPGEVGDVILSNLVNRATVLLNYRVGDRAFLQEAPCRCGRGLPLLSFPVGRVDDWLDLPFGRQINTQSLRTVFTNEERVWQYQVVQEAPEALRVRIVAERSADRPALLARVRAGFARVVGAGVAVEIDFVSDLERTGTGKVRTFISSSTRRQTLVPTA